MNAFIIIALNSSYFCKNPDNFPQLAFLKQMNSNRSDSAIIHLPNLVYLIDYRIHAKI